MGREHSQLQPFLQAISARIMNIQDVARRLITLLSVASFTACNSATTFDSLSREQPRSDEAITDSDRPWADSPWAALFDEGWEEGNDFTRAILADGVITSAEHMAAQEHAVQCMQMAGIEVWLNFDNIAADPLGRPQIESYEGTPEQEVIQFECLMEIGHIDWLYNNLNMNPNNEDPFDIIAACLVRNGIVPEGFTGLDFAEVNFRNSNAVIDGRTYFGGVPAEEYPYARQELDENGELQWVVEYPLDYVPEPVLLPGGVDINSPEAWQCQSDPRS